MSIIEDIENKAGSQENIMSLWWSVDCGAVRTHVHGIRNHAHCVKTQGIRVGEELYVVWNVV